MYFGGAAAAGIEPQLRGRGNDFSLRRDRKRIRDRLRIPRCREGSEE
jgi:hypothetical protein